MLLRASPTYHHPVGPFVLVPVDLDLSTEAGREHGKSLQLPERTSRDGREQILVVRQGHPKLQHRLAM